MIRNEYKLKLYRYNKLMHWSKAKSDIEMWIWWDKNVYYNFAEKCKRPGKQMEHEMKINWLVGGFSTKLVIVVVGGILDGYW